MFDSDTKYRMVSTDMLKFVNGGIFVSMSEMLNGYFEEKTVEELVHNVDLFVDNGAHFITTHDLLRKARRCIETFQMFKYNVGVSCGY